MSNKKDNDKDCCYPLSQTLNGCAKGGDVIGAFVQPPFCPTICISSTRDVGATLTHETLDNQIDLVSYASSM